MAIYWNIIGAVRKHHLGAFLAQQRLICRLFGGVATDQPMGTNLPDIADTRDWYQWRWRNVIKRIVRCGGCIEINDQFIDLGKFKAGNGEVEIEIKRRLILKLKREQDRNNVGKGKSGSVRVDLGGRLTL